MPPELDPNDFFNGGRWRDEYANDPDRLRRCLENPRNALRPWWDEETYRVLRDQGLGKELQRAARAGLDRLLDELGKAMEIDRFDRAVAKLLLESLMDQGRVFPVGELREQRQWIGLLGSESPSLAGIRSVEPRQLLKLLCNPGNLLLQKDELRPLIAVIVPEALSRAQGGSPLLPQQMARMAALRSYVLGNDQNAAIEQLDTVCKIKELLGAERMRQARDEFAGTGEFGLLADPIAPNVLEDLLQIPSIKESVSYFGFRLDPDSVRRAEKIHKRWAEESDAWVKLLLSVAVGNSEQAAAASRIADDLLEGSNARAIAFDAVVGRKVVVAASEIVDVLRAERVGDAGVWHERLFATLVEREVAGQEQAVRRCCDATGLGDWYDSARSAYRRSAGPIPAPPDVAVARLAQTSHLWAGLSPLDRHADDILADAKRRQSQLLRAEVDASGRGWLFDFIHACNGREPSGFDVGRGILTDEDRQQVLLLALQMDEGGGSSRRWWDVEMDEWRELRFREASARLLGRDDEELERLAVKVGELLFNGCQKSVSEDLLRESLADCHGVVVFGHGGGRARLLAAFRGADVPEFQKALVPVDIDLPPKRRRRRVFGRRVAVLFVSLLAIPSLLLWRVWTASASPASIASPGGAPASTAGVPLDPKSAGWRPLGTGGRAWRLAVGEAELALLFGDGVRRASAGGEGEPLVAFDIARTLVDRLGPWLRSQHAAGVRVGPGEIAPWSSIRVRLPRASDVDGESGAGGRRVWLDDGKTLPAPRNGSAKEGAVDVVVECRD